MQQHCTGWRGSAFPDGCEATFGKAVTRRVYCQVFVRRKAGGLNLDVNMSKVVDQVVKGEADSRRKACFVAVAEFSRLKHAWWDG